MSIVTSGEPTATVSPGWASSSTTVPANGLGSSTTAFSVSTSASTWFKVTVSPAATCQVTISASVRPSPRSGRRKRRASLTARPGAVDLVEDAVGVGQEVALELGRRVGRGEAAHPAHRCLEVVEAALRNAGGDFGAEATEDRRLVRHDEPARLAHRRLQRLEVDRRQRAQVEDLDGGALVGRQLRRREGRRHHGSVGGDGDVAPVVRHPGPVQGHGVQRLVRVDLTLVPVAPFGLEEDDGIVGGDGLAHHAQPVGRVARRHHAQAGGVGEVGLGGLGVVLHRADAPAVGDADGERHGDPALVAEPDLRHLRDDLVEGWIDEAVELDFAHGPEAAHGQPDRGADHPRLGQRCVDDPAVAEVGLEPLGDPEDATELPDVLTHEHHFGVVLHGLAQAGIERLAQ